MIGTLTGHKGRVESVQWLRKTTNGRCCRPFVVSYSLFYTFLFPEMTISLANQFKNMEYSQEGANVYMYKIQKYLLEQPSGVLLGNAIKYNIVC